MSTNGVDGARLEPVVLDDECKSDEAVANMPRLVHQDRAHLVIGSTSRGVTLARMGVATRLGVTRMM